MRNTATQANGGTVTSSLYRREYTHHLLAHAHGRFVRRGVFGDDAFRTRAREEELAKRLAHLGRDARGRAGDGHAHGMAARVDVHLIDLVARAWKPSAHQIHHRLAHLVAIGVGQDLNALGFVTRHVAGQHGGALGVGVVAILHPVGDVEVHNRRWRGNIRVVRTVVNHFARANVDDQIWRVAQLGHGFGVLMIEALDDLLGDEFRAGDDYG